MDECTTRGTTVIKQKDPVGLKSTKYSNEVQSQSDMAAGGKLLKRDIVTKIKSSTMQLTNTTSTNIIHTHHPILIIRH